MYFGSMWCSNYINRPLVKTNVDHSPCWGDFPTKDHCFPNQTVRLTQGNTQTVQQFIPLMVMQPPACNHCFSLIISHACCLVLAPLDEPVACAIDPSSNYDSDIVEGDLNKQTAQDLQWFRMISLSTVFDPSLTISKPLIILSQRPQIQRQTHKYD